MGNNLFGANISGQIAQLLAPLMLPATLIVRTQGARGAQATAGPAVTTTSYSCKGFIDMFTDEERFIQNREMTLIADNDRKIILFGDTISSGTVVPKTGDAVTIEDTTFEILQVERDPDKATYTCHGRA